MLVIAGLPLVCARARVPRITFDSFRHMTASFLVAAGTHVGTVSRVVGHHAPSVSLNVCTHRLGQGGADLLARYALAKLEATLGLNGSGND